MLIYVGSGASDGWRNSTLLERKTTDCVKDGEPRVDSCAKLCQQHKPPKHPLKLDKNFQKCLEMTTRLVYFDVVDVPTNTEHQLVHHGNTQKPTEFSSIELIKKFFLVD